METIKNYLETMFSQLPNTSEVIKAKNELGQIMEDKYQELLNEGKTENEAVGIVISEFGNLDELAEDLGIKSIVLIPFYVYCSINVVIGSKYNFTVMVHFGNL